MLIIGGGDGGCLREALKHPGVERVTQVEIDAGVIELSRRWLPTLSDGAYDHPKARVVIADGARFAAESTDRFDVVIVDSTDPQGPGAVLFTEPFYRDVRRLLNPGGIMTSQCGNPAIRPEELVDTQSAQRGAGLRAGRLLPAGDPDLHRGRHGARVRYRHPRSWADQRCHAAGAWRAFRPALLHTRHARRRVRAPGLDDRPGGSLTWPGSRSAACTTRRTASRRNRRRSSVSSRPTAGRRCCAARRWLAGSAGINLAITGFIDAAHAAGHELVALVWANACPSGPVTREAFERLATMMLDDLAAAGALDGLFLDLHGAMVTEHLPDGEGELLRRLREAAPTLPIVAALDLHANVSQAMVDHSDALVAYRTYPHIDLAATGARCLPLLERRISALPLAKAWRQIDFLIPLPWQCTTIEPGRELYARIAAAEAEGALSASICLGFPAADTPVCGPSVQVYATDVATAERVADGLAAAFDAAEPRFAGRLWDPSEAVAHAVEVSDRWPVILADTQDNPGGGGSADTTGLLAALIAANAPEALLALLCDPEAAAAAHAVGEGALLRDLALGGKHGPDGVMPLVGDFTVLRLGSGRFTATGPMYGGNRMDLGPMALLRSCASPGVEVAVSSRRMQMADRAILHHLGVDPASRRILALKSSVHFRADFEVLAGEVLVVAAPGANTADPSLLPFRHLRHRLRRGPGAS